MFDNSPRAPRAPSVLLPDTCTAIRLKGVGAFLFSCGRVVKADGSLDIGGCGMVCELRPASHACVRVVVVRVSTPQRQSAPGAPTTRHVPSSDFSSASAEVPHASLIRGA